MKNILVLIIASFSILNADQANAQTSSANNVPSQSITSDPIPKGLSVVGVFEGRPPCQEIAKQLKSATSPDCTKIKCRLILFQDSNTFQPTTYKFLGRFLPPEGKWKIIKGTKSNPDAVVFQLDLGKPGDSFYFLKGDENVLFILDEHKELRVGNVNFSYTLNRVELIQKK